MSRIEIGADREVLESIKEIPYVKKIHQIDGVYDLVIRVEAETLQELKDLVKKRIRGIGKIKSMLTLICAKEGNVQVGIEKRA